MRVRRQECAAPRLRVRVEAQPHHHRLARHSAVGPCLMRGAQGVCNPTPTAFSANPRTHDWARYILPQQIIQHYGTHTRPNLSQGNR